MLRTLRGRFILSHVLPVLVIIPIMGIALMYVMETQILLPNLASELTGQATLMAELTSSYPNLWNDPTQAWAFVAHTRPGVKTRIMLLSTDGKVLAANSPVEDKYLSKSFEPSSLAEALAGRTSVHTKYNPYLHAEMADVMVPVVGPAGQVQGIIRLSYPLESVYARFMQLRYLIMLILAVGLLLGSAVGWVLALDLARPLRQITQAVSQLTTGQRLAPLPEQGPLETRLLSHAFNVLVKRLQTLEDNRRRLLANLVHELGRPLGALLSAIQALSGGADQDTVLRRELLDGMAAEVRRLRRLLDDLAQLHGQILGTLEVERRPTDLRAWLISSLSPWHEMARKKGLQWQVTIPAELPTVAVDPDRLTQALGNLVSNAIKYTPSGGVVSVSAGIENGEVWTRVSDTGPGIAPEEQERIFTPFYRGQSSRRFSRGMGLGLNIARDLIVAHGGRLTVESTLGQGSHFTLWLPLQSSDN